MGRRVEEGPGAGKVWRAAGTVLRAGVLSTGLAVLASTSAHAQFGPLAPSPDVEISLNAELPRLQRPDGFDAFLGHLAATMPLRPNVGVGGGISFVHARDPGLPTSTIVSNVFFEVHFGGPDGYGALTFTFPTSGRLVNRDAYAADAGLDADLERPERFTRGTTGVAFQLHRRWRVGQTILVGGRGGLAVTAPSGFRREFYTRYAAFGESAVGSGRIGAEVSGAAFLNPDRAGRDRTVGEVTAHHLTLYAGMPVWPLSPHAYARLPIEDDTRRGLRALFGVRLTR